MFAFTLHYPLSLLLLSLLPYSLAAKQLLPPVPFPSSGRKMARLAKRSGERSSSSSGSGRGRHKGGFRGGGKGGHAPQDAEVAFWSTDIILIQ